MEPSLTGSGREDCYRQVEFFKPGVTGILGALTRQPSANAINRASPSLLPFFLLFSLWAVNITDLRFDESA
jgi:hypothetical protein